MPQVRFPPFGFGISEFGVGEPFKPPCLAFFGFRKIRFGDEGPERCTRSGFPPSGSDFRSLGSGSLLKPRFGPFSIFGKIRFGEDGPERCARSGFPPSGSDFGSLGSRSPLKPRFGRFSSFGKKTVFEIRVQKEAPGPVSPLRVRIFGVWVQGAF